MWPRPGMNLDVRSHPRRSRLFQRETIQSKWRKKTERKKKKNVNGPIDSTFSEWWWDNNIQFATHIPKRPQREDKWGHQAAGLLRVDGYEPVKNMFKLKHKCQLQNKRKNKIRIKSHYHTKTRKGNRLCKTLHVFLFLLSFFFLFLAAPCVWSSSSRSIWAKSTFPWSPIKTRSGRFSSIPSSSCSPWVAAAHQTTCTSCIRRNLKLCCISLSRWVKHVAVVFFFLFFLRGWIAVGRSDLSRIWVDSVALCKFQSCGMNNQHLQWESFNMF